MRLAVVAAVVALTAACATRVAPPTPRVVSAPPVAPAPRLAVRPARAPLHADFAGTPASPAARQLAHWVVDSGDNRSLGFVIVDKKDARVFVFDAAGRLRGTSPVLLGAATGDDSVPGIGERPLAQVRPEERTTPAGRFLGEPGINAHGEDIVWVDYDAAVSMHRLRAVNAAERRPQRLASPRTDDNRISYGCINVPPAFYNRVVHPLFAAGPAAIYVLPEVKPAQEVFGSYEVPDKARRVASRTRAARTRTAPPTAPAE